MTPRHLTKFGCAAAVAVVSATMLSLGGGAAAQPVATLLATDSEITFVSRQMGVPVTGRFTRFDAQIALDPRRPETGRVAFTIPVASATIGVRETDAELPKPAWFDAAKHPSASFESTAIKALGEGRFEVAGKLAIKGAARDVVVPVALAQAGPRSIATGAFTIKRLDFGIGEGEWSDTSIVANDVQVRFKLALSGLPPL
jgi:polyisoprenoid-binding protein YceI